MQGELSFLMTEGIFILTILPPQAVPPPFTQGRQILKYRLRKSKKCDIIYLVIKMIRFAEIKDIPKILDLLSQVDLVHHKGRPDIFKIGTKYNAEELTEIISDQKRPILVSTDENNKVAGYCFCIFREHKNDSVLTDIKTLYIDDLCVDETLRGKHIGTLLYEAAVNLAKENGCHNITLNVWSCNPSALKFYESLGMTPQKICMEKIL